MQQPPGAPQLPPPGPQPPPQPAGPQPPQFPPQPLPEFPLPVQPLLPPPIGQPPMPPIIIGFIMPPIIIIGFILPQHDNLQQDGHCMETTSSQSTLSELYSLRIYCPTCLVTATSAGYGNICDSDEDVICLWQMSIINQGTARKEITTLLPLISIPTGDVDEDADDHEHA